MALGTCSVFFCFLYSLLQSCSSPQIRRPPPLLYDKNDRLTSQSRTQCAPKYTHIHSNTLRISFIKVNAMHFQVGDNDTTPTEHQRHERELIHKNLPSSDSRDGPSQLDKTPREDSVEKKQIWDILNRHQHTINSSFQSSLSTGVNLHITGAKTRGRRSKKKKSTI